MQTAADFLQAIAEREIKTIERAIGLLWWVGRNDPALGMAARAICDELELAGHAKQNITRLHEALSADKRTSKCGKNGWRLRPGARRALDSEYASISKPRPTPPTDSVLPKDLFTGTRVYIERVVAQMNKSYDVELWDCCAVMCRRLLETLIIETYEKAGRAIAIKGPDGNFMMLSRLISVVEGDANIHLGRNAKKGLSDFKQLGDLSAHNRRFNACANDIDRVRDGLRVAAEEFLHLAGLR